MNKLIISITVTALTCAAFFVATSRAEVYQTIDKSYNLEVTPLDVTGSVDGRYTFVLAEGGKVLIFTESGEKEEIEVDPEMDRIFASATGEKIYLSSQKSKKMQEIFIDFQQSINIEDSPFLGDENGDVVIIAFSDFQ
jgi:hypothetical protein